MNGTRQPRNRAVRKRGTVWSLGPRNVRPANVGVVAGRRYYSPGLGRWASRDPIGEKGGANVHGFARNAPGQWFDSLGLWPWDGCCNGDAYNRLTHCCRNGKVLGRADQPTGVYLCAKPPLPPGLYFHMWVAVEGGHSVGFYPSGLPGVTTGAIHSPDPAMSHPDAVCKEIKLSPCKYDFEAFRRSVEAWSPMDPAPFPYVPFLMDCIWFQGLVIDTAKEIAKWQ